MSQASLIGNQVGPYERHAAPGVMFALLGGFIDMFNSTSLFWARA